MSIETTIFGYRDLRGTDVPACKFCDGRYAMLEATLEAGVLSYHFRCWCGAKLSVEFDSPEEFAEFVATVEAKHETRRTRSGSGSTQP
jgi:hypothetical protein